MKKKKFTGICEAFLIFGVFFFLEPKKYGAVDPNYVACQPRNCGNNLNISYPFYIEEKQPSYCGYPGFEVKCNKERNPTINIAENEYVIDDIIKKNRTFWVHNATFLSSNSICDPQQLKNVTLNIPFIYVDEVDLYLLLHCSDSIVQKLQDYKVSCADEYKDGLKLAILGNDKNLNYALKECSRTVVVPVEAQGNRGRSGGIVDYLGLLRRGFSLKWVAPDCSECEQSGGRCGFNNTTLDFICFCTDREHKVSCKNKHSNLGVIIGTVGAAVLILAIAIVFLLVRRCKKQTNLPLLSRNNSDPSLNDNVYFGVQVFSYHELKEIANNFDESNVLGDGGFGAVYYGKLHDGREVAVKRLYERSFKRIENFMNEIEILTRLRHRNLVTLYGCTSRSSRELLLVYEYISNGTIADHIHGDKAKDNSLTWPIRMKIAIETSQALAYLHASDIIHRDVKTNNILLDHNFCVKVADFGISRLFPNNVSHVSTAPQGTAGYVDPEYHQSYTLTEKSDVYSFGVVLIELISSMPAIDISRHSNEINLANYATSRIQRRAFDELIDHTFREDSDSNVMRMTSSVAELAFRCLQLDRDLRPTMDEVVEILKAIQCHKENENVDGSSQFISSIVPQKSHDSEDALFKKKVKFLSSPNSVTDLWVSSSTAAGETG